MKIRYLAVLFFLFGSVFSFGQGPPPLIEIKDDAPYWMKMMKNKDVNVFELQKEYRTYYKQYKFEKNTYTQYYKRYIRWARPFVNGDGKIQIPDITALNERERKANALRKSSSRMESWTFAGPNETWHTDGTTKVTWQTNVYCIDVAPSNSNVLYAGGESGGLWKTTNKGLTWSLKTKNIIHGAFGAVKIHPTNPNIVYAGTGGKIIKTIDGGDNWSTVYTESGMWTNEIAFSTSDPNIILAATETGLLRSVNGGTSWTKLFTAQVWTVKAKEGSTSTLYAVRVSGTSSQFIRSTDAGATWVVQSTGWWTPTAGLSVTGAIIATCPSNSNKLYVYLCGNGGTLNGFIGVFVSTNEGTNWANTNPSNLIGGTYVIPTHTNLMANNGTTGFNQGFYDMAIVVNPSNENELIAGGTSWFKSSDGGVTWNSLGGYVGSLAWSHPDIQWCVANGSDLWIASDGGINYSTDFGQSIVARMDGISGSDMWGFGSGWNTDILVGGRYHNGNMAYLETFPGGKFYRMGGAEAATGYVNPGPGNKVYHSDIGGYKLKPLFGEGVDYFSVGAWPNESYAYYANSEMVFHPNYYNTVFIGKDNTIMKSTDGGTTYTVLYTFPGTSTNAVYEIQIARSNPDVMYCSQWDGVDDTIWKTINGGISWTSCTLLPLPNNNDRVKIAVSSSDPNTLWVAVTYGSNGKKIYKSVNGGTSWINLTTTILNGITIQGVMAQFGTDGGIYLGTNAGVFYRNNSHSDWQPYSTGLPASVETNRLKPFYRDNKIRNGCWGFGVWESPLFEPSLPQAMPTVASRMVGCNRDTVYFDDYSVLNHSGAAWQWSFPGASYISSTTVRNPKVIYSIPGIYDVSLAITNALNQTDSKTIQGMVIVQTRCQPDTIPGKALVAEGSEKHGYVQDINLQNVNTLTITAWVKPNGIQPDYSAIFMGEGNDAAGFNFKDGSNQLAYHWPGGQWWWNSGINVPADQWSFVAMVVKPTGVTLYCNNQSATHNFTLTPTNIPSFRIGSYRNWGSRNMNGKIDEVAIYNRSLTTQEIRELQHLTKKPSNDPSLIAYYQFNTDDTHDYDKVGLHHVLLVGGAVKEVSTAPFGGGASQRLNINSGGLKNFNNVDFKIWHPVSGVYPNGEVVVTKINLRPDVNAPGAFQPNCYWVINNYGTNSTFAVPDSIRFFNSGNISGGCQASYFRLFRRAANADGNSWGNYIDLGDYYNPYPPDVFVTFSTGNNVNSFGQFVMTRDNRPNGDAVEICNGIDDNCDGRIDESYDLIVSNAADNGANTLRAILNCAQSGDTIRFGANIDTITLLSPLVLTKNLVLQDDIGPKVVLKTNLSGAGFNNASAAIQVSSGSTTTCINIHLLQSNNNLNKPVLFNAGSLVLESCKISGNPDSVIKNNLGAGFHARGLVEINK